MSAAPVQPQCLGTSGDHVSRSEQTQKVWARVCNYRKSRLQFHAARGNKGGATLTLTDIYKPMGILTDLFNASKSKTWGNTSAQSNLTKAFVICADTFAVEEQGGARPSLSHSDEMAQMLKWLTPRKDNQTMVIFSMAEAKFVGELSKIGFPSITPTVLSKQSSGSPTQS